MNNSLVHHQIHNPALRDSVLNNTERVYKYTLTLTYTYNTMPEWGRGNDAALPAGFFVAIKNVS